MEHIFTTYKGAKLHYTVQGKGKTVVLLHGFLEDCRMWTSLKRHIPSSCRLICIDLFGHGKSEGLGYIHHMEEMAEAVHTILREERIRKIHLAGHSMGGYVALAFAEKYPDSIRSLALVHSTARADGTEKKADRERAITLVKRDHRSFVAHAIPLLFSEKARSKKHKAIETLQKRAAEMSPGAIAASLEGMKIRTDREVILHFAPYPVLIIGGKTDTVISSSDIKEQMQAEAVTGVWLNTAHMGPWELPKKTGETLAGFWRKNNPSDYRTER
jgi:pimeloyl-ACP methyl ester carboxylesterase